MDNNFRTGEIMEIKDYINDVMFVKPANLLGNGSRDLSGVISFGGVKFLDYNLAMDRMKFDNLLLRISFNLDKNINVNDKCLCNIINDLKEINIGWTFMWRQSSKKVSRPIYFISSEIFPQNCYKLYKSKNNNSIIGEFFGYGTFIGGIIEK